MIYSLSQQRALAILPKVSGFISFLASSALAFSVLRDKKRRAKIYHRLLLGIAISNMSASFWLGLSTWPMPADSGILWASGSSATCNLQGTMVQFGISSTFYNASLALYFMLVVVYNWKEHRIRKSRIEYFLHGVPIAFASATSFTGLALGYYGSAQFWCWITSDHERFRMAAFHGPLWAMVALITMSSVKIFLHVRNIERSAQRHRFAAFGGAREGDPTNNPRVTNRRQQQRQQNTKRTMEVAQQSFLFAGAFYLNWAALTVSCYHFVSSTHKNVMHLIIVIHLYIHIFVLVARPLASSRCSMESCITHCSCSQLLQYHCR
jgi:hypothetical protein